MYCGSQRSGIVTAETVQAQDDIQAAAMARTLATLHPIEMSGRYGFRMVHSETVSASPLGP